MTKEQNEIREFMVKAGQQTPAKPEMPSMEVRKLRIKLIAEELLELCAAYGVDMRTDGDEVEVAESEKITSLVEAYDAVLDLMVVVIGTGVAQGTDLQPGWDEVHRSNMSKFIDGHRREDGKWIKGPSYSPADLAPILNGQSA